MTKTSVEDQQVLQAKFREAQALVSFYEAEIKKLRGSINLARLNADSAELREQILGVTAEIVRSGHSTSLLDDDYADEIKKLGKKYQQQARNAYECWNGWNKKLLDGEERPLAQHDEQEALTKFGSTAVSLLEIGLIPFRHLRDGYAACLKQCGEKAVDGVFFDGRSIQIRDEIPIHLAETERAVMHALVELRCASSQRLGDRSGVNQPGRVLKRIIKNCPQLQQHILLPGKKGPGYRTSIKMKSK